VLSRAGAFLGLVVLTLLWGSPVYAHGGASVTIHSDGRGSVWITARWQDGHPVNEPTPVTLTAVRSASGASPAGPSTLRQTGDERGTQTYSGTLDPGSWQVSIDLGAPVGGHCQALVQVAAGTASPLPVEVACLIPATSSSATPPAATGGSLTPLWLTLGALGATAATAALVTVVVSRRRSA
jgi:hypothetical protein